MPLSYNAYTATSGQTVFAFTFPVIANDHVKVSVNGTDLASNQYTVTTSPSSQVTLTSGATAGQIVRVYRQTPGRTTGSAVPLVDFVNGSVLSEDDLDKNSKQLLYLVQESDDTGSGALGPSFDGTQWDGESKKIQNLASPVSPSDAATKAYVDGTALYGTAMASPQSWTFSGTGSQTSFVMNPVPSTTDANLFIVEVGGVIQRPATNYTITSPATLVFTAAPDSGSNNIIVRNFGSTRNVAAFNDNVSFASDITVDTNVLHVNSSTNRVGVGTTSPQYDLDVSGTVRATTLIGSLQTAAQTNITSVGTLASLAVAGSITGSTVGGLAASLLPSGTILQVVQATSTSLFTSSSHSFTGTGLSASITPKRATSRIYAVALVHLYKVPSSTGNSWLDARLLRGASTEVQLWPAILYGPANGDSLMLYQTLLASDLPGTTSATTYEFQMRTPVSPYTPNTATLNYSLGGAGGSGSPTSSIILIEVAV